MRVFVRGVCSGSRAIWLALVVMASVVSGNAQTPILTTLYSFTGSSGANPEASVLSGSSGALVGTTPYGGAFGYGTIFELAPPSVSGGPWTQRVLYSFTGGKDGANPGDSLTRHQGALYGTTFGGGSSGAGTVFRLNPPAVAGGPFTETVLYSFTGGADGSGPQGNVVFGTGVLYGTTFGGGTAAAGTVFQLTPPTVAGGAWTETVIHNFQGGSDGSGPESGLVLATNGSLYGTTCCGTEGTVFRLTPPSTTGGTWTDTRLSNFASYSSGAFPVGALVIDASGIVYGTTSAGGSSGAGIVFSLTPPATKGPWTLTTIHSFTGGSDGGNPYGALALGPNGVLYSTVTTGGASGAGAVVQFTPPSVAGGPWTETVLYSFTGLGDGSQPYAGVIIGTNNVLFGTTAFGGASGYGTVYQLVP